MARSAETAPLLVGLALVGVGALLQATRPQAFDMPRRKNRLRTPGRKRSQIARFARDGITEALPANLAHSFGRSLILVGAGLIVVRALNEIADDDALA